MLYGETTHITIYTFSGENQKREQGLIFQGSLSLGLLLSLRLYSLAANVVLSTWLSQDAQRPHTVSATLLDHTHMTYHLWELSFWNVHVKDLWRKQNNLVIWAHCVSRRFAINTEAWGFRSVSVKYLMRLSAYASKEAYLTWKSERLEFLLGLLTYQNSVLPDFKKKIASWVRVSFCVHDYHGAQTTVNSRRPCIPDNPASALQMLGLQVWAWIVCFEWRLVEDIFFFLLVKKELSALPLWLSFVQKNKTKQKQTKNGNIYRRI